ncbi:unconventional myosin-XVIIIa-like isoform X2 [Lineus longissimus]|uniref:unconventional myosin-XVIIIa-like isoform X2 n=1 Tax=Lineus longissimus TaxID=88925 RepID=UPI00315E0294
MFNFKKKDKERDKADREEKERKKKEKKEKKEKRRDPITEDELNRLEEAKKGLFGRKWSFGEKDKHKDPKFIGNNSNSSPKLKQRDGAALMHSASDSSEASLASIGSKSSVPDGESQFSSKQQMQLTRKESKDRRSRPKKGILKGMSNYGPPVPNQGVTGNLDDTEALQLNTLANEMMTAEEQAAAAAQAEADAMKPGISITISPSLEENVYETPIQHSKLLGGDYEGLSSIDKTYGLDYDLELPPLAPPRALRARELFLKRQPTGDFGFTLRRGTVLERSITDAVERKRTVIFAEPGSGPRSAQTPLLPGDRLIQVNGVNVEDKSREEIIEYIRASGDQVILVVQPIPELSELSMRSGVDGADVPLDEEHLQAGSLRRSGSMRYKKKDAKTEDELESEKAWLDAEQVWLVHKGGYAAARVLKSTDIASLAEGRCKVRLDHGGEVLEVDEEDVERRNPPQFDSSEDLAALRNVNECSSLHTLRQRYRSNLIHTNAGPAIIIVNPMHSMSIYSEKVVQMFRGCKQEDMPPHIYATAQTTYRSMLTQRYDQSIVFMGRSGAGKTTNARHVLNFLVAAAGSAHKVVTLEKLHASFILLEAFGHSRTVMNTNASRFTQIYNVEFDNGGNIASMSLQVLMLEKTRIVRRPEGEPSFHVFYQMLAGLDPQLRKELQLQQNEENLFMTALQRPEDKTKAALNWAKIHASFQAIGATSNEIRAIFSVLAVIYHLGVAGATTGTNMKGQFKNPQAAQRAATLLGVEVAELARSIFNLDVTKSSRTLRPSAASPNKPDAADSSLSPHEMLEGFLSGLYTETFNAVVSLMNRSTSSNIHATRTIYVVDTPGLQTPSMCGRETGATFEDLCHNYTQERMQLLFSDSTIRLPQDRYAQENIECDVEPSTPTPAPMVALIDRQGTSSTLERITESSTNLSKVRANADTKEEKGLLWLLDEEAIFPGASDESFVERLFLNHGASHERKSSLIRRNADPHMFTLNHLQGTCPIKYSAKGWLKACRENPVSRNVLAFLQESPMPYVSELYSTLRGPMTSTFSGSIAGMIDGSSSLKRTSSLRRSFVSGAASLKRRSVGVQVKYTLDSIMDQLRRTKVHFIQCILPQPNAGLCDLKGSILSPGKAQPMEDLMINVPLVRLQLRGAQILDAVRMHRQGYPDYMLFLEFHRRYEMLSSTPLKHAGQVLDERHAVEQLLNILEVETSSFRIGLSQVFFRSGVLSQLDDAREDKISGTILKFQAYCRGYIERQNLKKRKVQNLAVKCIQRNVRKFLYIQSWPWWRLYTKVLPILNVHRTEEELKDRAVELEQLMLKLEKLEKERNDYKHSCDKLEDKLAEISADFLEENTTSHQAAEMLEVEQAERMRLEKELRDVQSRQAGLQRKNEQLEMEVMQARLWQSAMDGEVDDDDGDSDVYKQRYDRAKRELEFTKKKMQQEHEEKIEQEHSIKKQVERKLLEALEEADEQKRIGASQKRKSLKLNADLQDMRLHLEEQISRNADLEKKQRKFDAELARQRDEAGTEHSQRVSLERERDQLIAENFSLKQQIDHLQSELDSQGDQLHRLQNELRDLEDVGSKDDKEVMALKRTKYDLEIKCADQEEELDEQAGQIQQLGQAKLRLEMTSEKQRQQHQKDLEDKDTEIEDMRYSTQKRVKQLEMQIEDEYEEKQRALKEKRELERQLNDFNTRTPIRDRDAEKGLRRDLKRTKALLRDAQKMLERQRDPAGTRNSIKQLRNQLEDANFATAAAVKARKSMELEVQEIQQQLDVISRSKQEAEEKGSALAREKNEIESRLEDHDEEYAELMKKYKAVVQQQSADNITISDQCQQIMDLHSEKQTLHEQVMQLQTRVDYMTQEFTDKQALLRNEAKIRELDSKVDLERTVRQRLEVQHERLKDQSDRLNTERDDAISKEQRSQELNKRTQRQLRDLRDEFDDAQRKEAETSQKKHEIEMRLETLESDFEQSQSDLKLAFKRIADLQAALEEDMDSDDDENGIGIDLSDSDSDTDVEFASSHSNLMNHMRNSVSTTGSHGSLDDFSSPKSYSSARDTSLSPDC